MLAPLLLLAREYARDLLELLVLDQPSDELLARVFLLRTVVGLLREEHLDLDADQRGGHLQELACQRQVKGLHEVDVLEVLLGDGGYRYVVDVYLVLTYQV